MSEDKNIETAKSAWQSQRLEAPQLSIEYLRNRASEHTQESRTRNLIEYLCGATALALCFWPAVMGQELLLRAGALLTSAGVLFSLYRWRQMRVRWSVTLDGTVADGLRFYKRELARMRDMHRDLWKCLPAMLPGTVTLLAWGLTERTTPGNTRRIIVLAIATVVWIAVMLRHEAQEANRYARELDALEQDGESPA